MRVSDTRAKECCEVVSAHTSHPAARQMYWQRAQHHTSYITTVTRHLTSDTSHISRHASHLSPFSLRLTRIILAAAGLAAAAHPETCDAISVVIDAMVASGSFARFSFWNIVAIALAKLVVHVPPLTLMVGSEEGGERMTLDEVTCDV